MRDGLALPRVDFPSVARRSLAVIVVALALVGASDALACGTQGYSYAGVAAPRHAFGIGATVTPLTTFSISTGHVAGWVGVGGPHQGPGGSDEWLQVGFNAIGGLGGPNLYYEVVRAGGGPTYHQVAANVPAGKAARVAVLEMHARPNWWRVWVNGSPASQPIRLAASHGRWAPIATAESWDGGSGTCNPFLYRFHGVSIARAPGGGWTPLVSAMSISSGSTLLHRSRTSSSFLAAQGAAAVRTLASFSP
jgi:hypothetical protein